MEPEVKRAPAPQRATSSMVLGLGPISIPVSIYSGAQESSVKRSEYTKDGRRVGRASVVKDTDPPEFVGRGDVVKLVETSKGLVALEDWEIDELVDIPTGQLQILSFVNQAHLAAGRYVPQALYQVRPKPHGSGRDAKPNPAADHAFSLLMRGMARTGTFAAVQFSLRGRPRYGALLPNGRLYALYFDDEVRADLPLAEDDHSEAELDLMRKLIEQTSTPVTLENRFSPAIREYLEKKAENGDALVAKTEADPDDSPVDLMGLLEKAIA